MTLYIIYIAPVALRLYKLLKSRKFLGFYANPIIRIFLNQALNRLRRGAEVEDYSCSCSWFERLEGCSSDDCMDGSAALKRS